jgi:hypothetical protein
VFTGQLHSNAGHQLGHAWKGFLVVFVAIFSFQDGLTKFSKWHYTASLLYTIEPLLVC